METKKWFIEELVKAGYPRESIIENYSDGLKKHRIDIAIIDLETNKIIAIFEIKKGNPKNLLKNAVEQCLQISSDLKIPVFILLFLENETTNVYKLLPDAGGAIKIPNIPPPTNIGNALLPKRIRYQIIETLEFIEGETYCEVFEEYNDTMNDNRIANDIIDENQPAVGIIITRIGEREIFGAEWNCYLALEILVINNILRRI